jgi:hypothetical protein
MCKSKLAAVEARFVERRRLINELTEGWEVAVDQRWVK